MRSKRRVGLSWILAVVVLLLPAGAVFAQTSNGTLTGTVKDSSGLVIPGASVTAADPSTNVTQTVVTDKDGVFFVPQLPPGRYTVTVELTGFKKSEKSNVIVSMAAKVNAGVFVLEVGSLAETVTVEAALGLLQIQTESGERSELVTKTQLRDIALNGRNVMDFMKLVPGVITTNVRTQSTVLNITDGLNINGTRSIQHEYTVDGATNLNLGNNSGGLVSVNPDALEEVKVLTSNYQAEYGRAGGGYIALTTKGGTTEYRGSLRYFRRHDSMNANTYFNNLNGGAAAGYPRPLYRYNDYGWDLGGPVPGVGSKTNRKLLFFVAQEYYDQLVPQASAVNIRVPTEAERRGDFSQSVDGTGKLITVIDPLTGKQFPGNIVPADRIYAPGQATLNVFPTPNQAGQAGGNVYNYSSQVPSKYPRREDVSRIDWQIRSSTRLSARWVHNYDAQKFAYGTTTASWNFPLTTTERRNGPGNTLSFTLTHNVSASMFNEFLFAAGRGGVHIAPADDHATRTYNKINTPLLYPDVNSQWGEYIPALTYGGIASVSTIGSTSGTTGPFDQKFIINTFSDSLTKVAGRHTLKAGVYYQRASNTSNSQTNVSSSIDFSNNAANPYNTGHPYANALLGVYTTYSQANAKPVASYFYYDLSGYIQDTWRVRSNLTLDVGFRLSHYEPYYNKKGDGAYFDPSLYSAAQAPRLYRGVCVTSSPCSGTNVRAIDPAMASTPTMENTLPTYYVGKIVANSGSLTNGMGLTAQGYPRSGMDGQTILPQPRLGFSWDVAGDRKTVVRGGFGVSYDRYSSSDGSGSGATNQPFVLNPTLNYGYLQDITSGGSGYLAPQAVVGVDRHGKFPMIATYSLGVQHDLWKGIIVDVAYVGSLSRNNPRRVNLNAPALGAAFKASNQDPTKFAGGVIPAAESSLPSIYSAANVSFSGANALATDFMRPYQGYSDITYYMFDGKTTYNSLQVQVKRSFARTFTFGLSYMLSKAVTTISTDGIYTSNISPEKYDRGLGNWNRTHYFTANYVWNLPKVSTVLGGGGFARGAGLLLDNWTLTGFTWIVSGNPSELAVTISGQDAALRLIGTPSSGNLSGNAVHFYVTGKAQTAANKINASAYRVPGVNDIGPYSRYELTNPGFVNHDLSLFKNFPFGGAGKRYLQLRFEAFNVFNSVQFAGVNRTTNITNAAGSTGSAIFNDFTGLTVTNNVRPSGSTKVLGTYFGEYTSTRDPRIIQLGVKLYF
jgi:hypothetical protein